MRHSSAIATIPVLVYQVQSYQCKEIQSSQCTSYNHASVRGKVISVYVPGVFLRPTSATSAKLQSSQRTSYSPPRVTAATTQCRR
jgi:hypothetical protein